MSKREYFKCCVCKDSVPADECELVGHVGERLEVYLECDLGLSHFDRICDYCADELQGDMVRKYPTQEEGEELNAASFRLRGRMTTIFFVPAMMLVIFAMFWSVLNDIDLSDED